MKTPLLTHLELMLYVDENVNQPADHNTYMKPSHVAACVSSQYGGQVSRITIPGEPDGSSAAFDGLVSEVK